MKKYFLILVFIPVLSFAQFKKLKSWDVSEEILSCYVDRPGDLYVLTTGGQFLKYDKNGTLQVVYKHDPPPTLFDPRDGARLFAFYRNARQYAYLSPSFDVLDAIHIDSAFVTEPWLVCPSGDLNAWVIDSADGTLKKINARTGHVDVEVTLDASVPVTEIMSMREYQGFLFCNTKTSGIMLFNSLGKLIKILPDANVINFNFLGEELYYVRQGRLKFLDLFSAETLDITLPEPCKQALLTDERLYLLAGKTINLFEYNP
jgi:hypothetical protein